jgi:hypothetical protein
MYFLDLYDAISPNEIQINLDHRMSMNVAYYDWNRSEYTILSYNWQSENFHTLPLAGLKTLLIENVHVLIQLRPIELSHFFSI